MPANDDEEVIVVADQVAFTDGTAACFKIRSEKGEEVGAVQFIRAVHTGIVLIDIDVGAGLRAVKLEFTARSPGPLNAGLAERLWKQAAKLVEMY